MRGTPFYFENFSKGLNTIDSPYTLEPGESRDLLNVVSTTRGSIKKRYGSTAFSLSNPTTEMTSLAAVNPAGTRYLIVSNGKEIWSLGTTGTLTEIGKGFTAGTYWSIIQAEKGKAETAGPVYLSNGVDAPQYWTGAEAKTLVAEWKSKTTESEEKEFIATPKAKYLVYAGDRVWAAGMTSEPSAVRFTETTETTEESVPDPTMWPKHNFVQFDPEDGLPITGLGRVGPYILVFKAHKTWVIYNLDEGSNRKLSDSTGCIAHRSIAESEAGTFFLTADQGVYVTNGSNLKEVSYNIRPTLLSINPAKREQAAGAYFNNHYYLSFATGTESVANRTVDYDLVLKSWWLHDLTANQWTPFEATTGEPFLFIIPPVSKAGVVKAFDPTPTTSPLYTGYTDRGSAYTGNGVLSAWWISAWDPFAYYIFRHRVKAPMLKKRVRQVFFDGEGEIIPSLYRNFSVGERQEPAVVGNAEQGTEDKLPVEFLAGTEKWGVGTGVWGAPIAGQEVIWGGETSVGSARLYAPGVARVWGVGYGNKSSKGFTVHSYALMASFRKS